MPERWAGSLRASAPAAWGRNTARRHRGGRVSDFPQQLHVAASLKVDRVVREVGATLQCVGKGTADAVRQIEAIEMSDELKS